MGMEAFRPLAARYLRWVDRVLPGRVVGFYVVGSAALDAFRPGRSDLDFVAVIDRTLTQADVRRARLAQVLAAAGSARRALPRGFVSLPGTCNGVFVLSDDLHLPVSKIVPMASQTGWLFSVGEGFDANPVIWKIFAERGVTIRGAEPSTLGLDPEPERLRPWNVDNLERYWARWADSMAARARGSYRIRARWMTAWGVLGAPRLHRTIATGEVISKEAAGEYALATFDERWHPIIDEGLAYWRQQPPPRRFSWEDRLRETTAFVRHVAEDGARVAASS
jgi:hypothetical protein